MDKEENSNSGDIILQKILKSGDSIGELIYEVINEDEDIVFIKDEEFRYIIVNNKLARFFQKEKADILYKTDSDFMDNENAENCRKSDLMVVKSGNSYINEEAIGNSTFIVKKFPVKFNNGKTGIGAIIREISDIKRYNEIIKEKTELLKATNMMAKVGGWELEVKTYKVKWTEETFRIHEENEIDAPPEYYDAINYYHPDDRIKISTALNNSMKSGNSFDSEFRFITAKGNSKWVRVICEPIIVNGEVVKLRGTVKDITDRKIPEITQKIQYNIANAVVKVKSIDELYEIVRKELSALFDTTNFLVAFYNEQTDMLKAPYRKDEKENILEWSAEKSLTGYVIKEKKSLLLYKDDILQLAENGSIKLLGERAEVWIGVPLIINEKAIGAIVIQNYENPAALDTHSMEILEMIASQISIYIEKKKSDEIANKLKKGIEQNPISVVITDYDGNIEFVNPKFLEITGYTFEEAIGQNPRILKSGEHNPEFYDKLWETIKSGKDWRGEFHDKKKNGELYWENAIISPIVNEEGKITHFIAVKEDITEKKKMIEELIRAKEKAEEMNKVKSVFFANMSHELRTPLNGILGFSELLQEELSSDSDLKGMAETINKSGNRLLETLNMILNISKLEAEMVDLNFKKINIVPLIEETVRLYSPIAQRKNIDLRFITSRNNIDCLLDINLLNSVVNNLVNNALKYTKAGSVSVEVNTEDENAVIKISDTGIGIPKSKQQRIWEAFRQVSEGFNRSFEGTGLGLTITKKYVGLLKGEISLESEENKGSVFTVRFPLMKSSIPGKTIIPSKQKAEKEQTENKNSGIKILFVDDDIDARNLVKAFTDNLYILDYAVTAEEAIKKVIKNKYDIILMDINLRKGPDGVEAMQSIREIDGYKHTQIIAVTAYAMNNDREEFLEQGFDDYLPKPFRKAQLLELLKNAEIKLHL